MSKIEGLPQTYRQFLSGVKQDSVYTQEQVSAAESLVGKHAPGYIKNIALASNEFPERRSVVNLFQHPEQKK